MASDKAIKITNSTPSEKEARLKRNDRVRWEAADKSYELWFSDVHWPFAEDPDRHETGYFVIEVEFRERGESMTRQYKLTCHNGPGAKCEHDYDIRLQTAPNVSGPPNGPVIIGEG